jgi:hypothetical protein
MSPIFSKFGHKKDVMNIARALKIPGWMTEKELNFLARTAKKAQVIIEVGCYQGRATRAMADNTDGTIYSIDTWNSALYDSKGGIFARTDDTTRHLFYCNLFDHIKNRKVILCPMKFTELTEWSKILHRPDFIFIDADHRYNQVLADIYHGLKFNPAIIAGHDYSLDWPDVIAAVNKAFPDAIKEDTIWWKRLRL